MYLKIKYLLYLNNWIIFYMRYLSKINSILNLRKKILKHLIILYHTCCTRYFFTSRTIALKNNGIAILTSVYLKSLEKILWRRGKKNIKGVSPVSFVGFVTWKYKTIFIGKKTKSRETKFAFQRRQDSRASSERNTKVANGQSYAGRRIAGLFV